MRDGETTCIAALIRKRKQYEGGRKRINKYVKVFRLNKKGRNIYTVIMRFS